MAGSLGSERFFNGSRRTCLGCITQTLPTVTCEIPWVTGTDENRMQHHRGSSPPQAVRRKSAGYQLAFLADITLGNIASHCVEHRRHLLNISGGALPRLAGIVALSAATAPLRTWERLRWQRALSRVELPHDPIFIIGHWRSGTTHLHNLLTRDPRYGWISNLQAAVPETILSFGKPARWVFQRLLPGLRPMDNMSLALDAPQEGEIALSKVVPHTFFSHLLNPQDMEERFDSSIMLSSVSPRARRVFQQRYLQLVRKATQLSDGRPLMLKNPANTGRLDLIREVFPNSRFVFVHRDPYDVFNSMVHFYKTLFPMLKVQPTTDEATESLTLTGYEVLHRRYLEQRQFVPESHLIEVGFGDLERDPMGVARRIYRSTATSATRSNCRQTPWRRSTTGGGLRLMSGVTVVRKPPVNRLISASLQISVDLRERSAAEEPAPR